MQTVTAFPDLRAARAQLLEPVGLVPTMGYLHEGHLSLVRRARTECASVVASIFVNPTQFGPGEDLAAYPRDLPSDQRLLESEGVDLVWTPTPEVMYPEGFQTWVTVEEVTQPLEGARRPGHFRGVTTIVAKLFNGVLPQRAYFGQKDAQQARVIQQMTRDLNFPIQIVVCPIVREADGLAMSSRNTYLDPDERRAATVLHHALTQAQAAFDSGERDANVLRAIVTRIVGEEPLAALQYVSCAHPETLEELETIAGDRALLSMAVYVGKTRKTRLIDNVVLDSDAQGL
ncbi:MAG TPA: pantoate--beta-alanine ligase [Chloroflexi bacterium]|nr:pantoate--beta-alanine ligase [Chloroflexota bacterium]